eukprot:3930245-Amphidinium_carterae.1
MAKFGSLRHGCRCGMNSIEHSPCPLGNWPLPLSGAHSRRSAPCARLWTIGGAGSSSGSM